MKEVRTEITLEAPPERIWELLTDFPLYPQWNPLFERAVGDIAVGRPLELSVRLPGMEPFALTPRLTSLEPHSALAWEGRLWCGAVLRWKYGYRLEPLGPTRVSFIQSSSFSGLLAPLFSFALNRPFASGMIQLNQALRRWGEKGNVRCLRC